MVIALLLALAAAADPAPATAEPARAALKGEGYPWYDPACDSARPILPAPPWNFDPGWKFPGFGGGKLSGPSVDLGRLALIAAGAVGLGFLIALMVRAWLRARPALAPTVAESGACVARVEGLPAELTARAADPRAEAIRRRAAGDLAGAIAHLFAHELLALARAERVRLAPGKTGRQLVRSVVDPGLRNLVAPTLRLFEASAYGHRPPTAVEYDTAWESALRFERDLEGKGVA